MTQLALDGRDARVKTYRGHRFCCSPCWCARCVACRVPLTKHAFTEQEAHDEAVSALDRPGHFQHVCVAREAV